MTRTTGISAALAVTAALSVVTGTAFAGDPSSDAKAPAKADAKADAESAGPTVKAEYFPDPNGTGRHTTVPARTPARIAGKSAPLPPAAAAADGRVTTLSETGRSSKRLDVTIIGDGYTAAQQADFLSDARKKWGDVTKAEPYKSYAGLMNVRAVGAVSRQSGVSGDPTQNVVKDTALGSYFFCDGMDRLLCVDLEKVKKYAAKSPATDLVIVVSNSKTYGGAGYSELGQGYPFAGVSTLSSDNPDSSAVAVHEIGHSVGLLADEYDYGQEGSYTGPESPELNTSIYSKTKLATRKAKWYRWLGENDPSGGKVGAFEGAGYYEKGLNRPTEDSLMRSLASTTFNLPGREGMIMGFYRYSEPLTRTAPTGTVNRRAALKVTLAKLRTGVSKLQLRWYVDGREVVAARGKTQVRAMDLGVPADSRTRKVTAKAVDATTAIRDPKVRKQASTTLSWTVRG